MAELELKARSLYLPSKATTMDRPVSQPHPHGGKDASCPGGNRAQPGERETAAGPRHSLSSPLTWHFSTAVLRSSWSLTSLSMRLHLCRRTRTSVVDSGISLTVKRSMSLKACVTVARYLSTESSAPKKFSSWVEAKVGLLGANATD